MTLKIKIEIDEEHLKELVRKEISELCGLQVPLQTINIETKSNQNYRATWESADFRAVYEEYRNGPTT